MLYVCRSLKSQTTSNPATCFIHYHPKHNTDVVVSTGGVFVVVVMLDELGVGVFGGPHCLLCFPAPTACAAARRLGSESLIVPPPRRHISRSRTCRRRIRVPTTRRSTAGRQSLFGIVALQIGIPVGETYGLHMLILSVRDKLGILVFTERWSCDRCSNVSSAACCTLCEPKLFQLAVSFSKAREKNLCWILSVTFALSKVLRRAVFQHLLKQ